jgi:hypothetical protein
VKIVDALADKRLFGALPAFKDLATWRSWLVFLKAVYGLDLDQDELAIFRSHTGRSKPSLQGYAEAVAIVGRQSGKTQLAATLAVYEAITAPVASGRGTYAVLVSQDARAALRTLFRYAASPFEVSPILQSSIASRTTDSLELDTGVTLSAYPCKPQAVRGLRARVAICDELAFFRSTENIPTDVEMLRALRPTLATTRRQADCAVESPGRAARFGSFTAATTVATSHPCSCGRRAPLR